MATATDTTTESTITSISEKSSARGVESQGVGSAPSRPGPLVPEQRVLLRGIDWNAFETILKAIGDQPAIRLTYDHGDLEFMSPSVDHEVFKKRFARLIQTLTMVLDIPCEGAGSTTWKKMLEQRGLEPDECYYIANSARVAGRRDIDLNLDPPPDLAVEIEISRGALNCMSIYAALRVSEVWRFNGETLIVECLQEDGTYAPRTTSPSFPFLPLDRLVKWVNEADSMSQTNWIRQFSEWVRDELAPRYGQP